MKERGGEVKDLTSKLNCYAELWGKIAIKNKLNENDTEDAKIKNIWCNILPQGAGISSEGDIVEKVNHTHKIKVRTLSIKEPKKDMFFMYKGLKYEIKYWNPDFKNNNFLDIFCKLILE